MKPYDATTHTNTTTFGEASARVALVAFSDYQCPYCARFARDVFPRLKGAFIDAGLVTYVFRDMPIETIHPLSFRASEAAECAREQGPYWPMHERLFASGPALTSSAFELFGKELGLNQPAYRRCLDDGRRQKVEDDLAEARRLGIKQTPTFLIGSVASSGEIRTTFQIIGNQPYEIFHKQLEDALAASQAGLVASPILHARGRPLSSTVPRMH